MSLRVCLMMLVFAWSNPACWRLDSCLALLAGRRRNKKRRRRGKSRPTKPRYRTKIFVVEPVSPWLHRLALASSTPPPSFVCLVARCGKTTAKCGWPAGDPLPRRRRRSSRSASLSVFLCCKRGGGAYGGSFVFVRSLALALSPLICLKLLSLASSLCLPGQAA